MQIFGSIFGVLWLALPVGAIVSIVRRRRNRPGASCWFAYAVLFGWIALEAMLAVIFVTGGWYSESGPPLQVMAGLVLVLLVPVSVMHWALFSFGSRSQAQN